MKKKVLFIIPLLNSYRNFLQELGEELYNRGFEVFLLTNNSQNERINHIKIMHVDFPRGMNILKHFRCAYKIRKLVEIIHPNIIHTHFSANIFTVSLAKKNDWPCTIATFHGLSFPLVKNKIKRLFLRFAEIHASRQMDWVCVLTQDDASLLKNAMPSDKIYCYKSMGVGCDIQRFNRNRYTEEECVMLRSKLNICETDVVLIFIGRFTDFKGFHLVVQAFNKLNDINYKLLLLGKKDKLHATGLSKSEEEELNQNPHVINVGFVANVEDYLAISDIMLFPSIREGMPVCVMEALAMEVPAIVPNSRGCNSLISTGNNGFILENLSISSIDEAIKIVRLMQQMHGAHMKEYMQKNRTLYDRNNFIDEQISMYEQLDRNKDVLQ